ncbi:DinB family protein [Fibrella forsythiae]|uniref:DUF664 domain-containing protein n=1 Tax=Fibrella forsythiae TaxID=2817061 RepID=A0ABS3JTW6_9BACT|nr:DUF664 domain-containing protein [Fibrella forsythiae]MBO0952352.1 DUF664 domain-containing protein [Fibrella forsythiae]
MYNRRKFVSELALFSAGAGAFIMPHNGVASTLVDEANINHIGPKTGFTPQIGTLLSMLDWVSDSVIRYNSKLSVEQLDFLFDKESNTIGSLMLHLAATEVIYQDITFHGLQDFSAANKPKWGAAMELGENARNQIKGNPLSYYKDAFDEVRAVTKAEMKKRDDAWLLAGETKDWDWNNYCKWFHVTEHYANHRGQMTWYAKRLPK